MLAKTLNNKSITTSSCCTCSCNKIKEIVKPKVSSQSEKKTTNVKTKTLKKEVFSKIISKTIPKKFKIKRKFEKGRKRKF